MEKKIIKAMYSSIVSKDTVRPMMTCIFFDEDCCVASDTHVLVKFNRKFPEHKSKILNAAGEKIDGNYPNYKRVFPSKERLSEYIPRIDLAQLQKACAWFVRQPGFDEKDSVVIRGKGLTIRYLSNLLNLLALTPEIKTAKAYKTPDGNPIVIKSKRIDALQMPVQFDESMIDAPREDGCAVILSLENLINQFVFEGWKPKPVEDPLAWL